MLYQMNPPSFMINMRIQLPKRYYEIFYNAVRDFTPRCPVCGQRIYSVEDFEIGHIISVFHKGDNRLCNLVALHRWCNIGTDNLTHRMDEIKDRSEFLMFETPYPLQ